ncbi:MAG: threonine/serine exporter ThrE family protein [Planctomycetota bacterium]
MSPSDFSDLLPQQKFLVQTATLLHQLGAPSHRLERVIGRLARVIEEPVDVLYTPTSLLLSFESGSQRTVLKRIEPGDTDLGKLYEVDEALEYLEDGKASLAETSARLTAISQQGERYPLWLILLSAAVVSGCVTVFLGAGIREVLFATLMGGVIQAWGIWLRRIAPQENLLEVTAGFFCAAIALALSAVIPAFDDRIATLGSLIILVPGLNFTVAMTELANRHFSSGVARLAWAAVVFLALACGVAMAWRLGAELRPAEVNSIRLPGWAYFVALFISPFLLAILFQARRSEWSIIVVVAWAGFISSATAAGWKGSEFGALVGALVIGLAGNLYARWLDRPALVATMPGILLLVPGSLGYRSLTAFIEQEGLAGLEFAFGTVLIAISIVGGLLVSNLLAPPRRSL